MDETPSIYVLGVPHARKDRDERVLLGPQQRLILAYAALRKGNPVTVDELAEALWPRERGRSWEGALRGIISKVRAFLGFIEGHRARLDSVGHAYRLASSSPMVVDIWAAPEELAIAESSIEAGRFVRSAPAARKAAVLLDAPLLPGVEGDWLDAGRRQIALQRLRALRIWARAESELGHHDAAVCAASFAIEADSLDETSHRTLMLAHRAAGNRGSALRAYQECRRCLETTLGVSPCAETERVYLDLLGVEPEWA